MQIASLVIEGFPNSIYRSFIPMEALALRGHGVHVEERNDVRRPERFEEFDVVCFWRCFHEPMQLLARRLSRAGVAMVWDNDDDLAAIPRGVPAYQNIGGLRGRRAMAEMTRMMRTADVVTVPSESLAERYREASGVEPRVIENYLPTKFVRPRFLPRRGVTIGWLAGLEHRADYNQLRLREPFLELLRRHPDVRIVSIGLNLALGHPRYEGLPITAYGDLPKLLAQFDVGIAPLADIPFNRSRSNIKLKEYSAIGVPWLASPIGPYAGMGPEQGGELVADDGWFEALSRLVGDADRRSRLAQRARAWARGETIADHVEEWERTLEDAIDRARAVPRPG